MQAKKYQLLFAFFLFVFLPFGKAQFVYEWGFGLGGEFQDRSTAMKLDPQDNVILAGMYGNTVDFNPGEAVSELTGMPAESFLAKYSKGGDLIWVKDLEITPDDTSPNQFPDLDVDQDGNSFVVGYIQANGQRNIYFAKYDPDGNLLWDYEVPGEGIDEGRTIHALADGACLVTGSFSGTRDFAPGAEVIELSSEGVSDLFIAKYDADGALLWVKKLGGPVYEQTEIFQLTTNMGGDIYIAGQLHGICDFDPANEETNSTIECEDYKAFIAKYDASGNFLWVKKVESTLQSSFSEILVDHHGDLLVTGRFQDTLFFVPDSEEVMVHGEGWIEAFLAKYSADGEFIWGFPLSSSFTDEGHSIEVDAANQVHITGFFGGEEGIDLDPSAAEAIFPNAGWYDMFYAFYDEDGNYIDGFTVGGEEVDSGVDLEIDSKGHVVIAGWYVSENIDLDVTEGMDIFTTIDLPNFFLIKYEYVGPTTATNILQIKPIAAFPNPVTAKTPLYLDLPTTGQYKIEIANLNGQLISEYHSEEAIISPDIPGMYFILIYENGAQIHSQKLIVIE